MRVTVNFGWLDEQVQTVTARMVTIYPHKSDNAEPELVVHYDDKPQDNVPLRSIKSITITER